LKPDATKVIATRLISSRLCNRCVYKNFNK
jgi:hypothetical protein